MTAVPPPYAPRDYAQVQPGPSNPTVTSSNMEFAESASVCLEWRLTGLRNMYDTTKGDAKSKCIKSAIFGDVDNLWEVLWYPNSGVQGGEYASLYLSCVERESCLGGKWSRKGLWWFRFEIKSTIPDERTGKIVTLATKDASDHTFAVKTANWGWQQFAKRDQLFLSPTVLAADNFTIVCTIQAQSQPPAGYWLGMGLPPRDPVEPITAVQGRSVGSGGGLSAWSGGNGAAGGVAGGTTAGGGVKTVVPKDLISSIGGLLDDPLYSDVEFIIPPRKGSTRTGSRNERTAPRRIYANKKLLCRCEYFEAMFNGGFREVEGVMEDYVEDEDEDDEDALSDSDVDDELPSRPDTRQDRNSVSSLNSLAPRPTSTTAEDRPTEQAEDRAAPRTSLGGMSGDVNMNDGTHAGGAEDETSTPESPRNKEVATGNENGIVPAPTAPSTGPRPTAPAGQVLGPRKTKVMIRDAAWSTWWAVLYWIYTDIIYFAPLSSTFEHTPPRNASDPKSRREWVRQWSVERGLAVIPSSGTNAQDGSSAHLTPLGPRPVSAKSVYRLADKLDLPALKLRAFQHICSELTSDNIPAEVFSRFSSTFEDVRKVEVAFFLKHWSTLKKSTTMAQIWPAMRAGKHVGLEEVWPLILSQLEFKPS